MAPHAPRAAAAAVPTEPTAVTEDHPTVKGPHPGYVAVGNQYTFEQKLRRMQKENGCDPTREDNYRLQGVQLIENIRESLQLPVKTFDTACTYYHKFRLNFRDAEYNYQDAAVAALFVACKVEDTIKKSREILCAAYNIKNPEKPTTQDDKMFEHPSKVIIGLERLILETIGFDFRVRFPQKLLTKIVRKVVPAADANDFFSVAYPMCLDLYKTFSPIKQSTFTMVISVVELAALVTEKHVVAIRALDPRKYHTTRAAIIESMLDLLDLYVQFRKDTKAGMMFELEKFMDIKIKINEEVDKSRELSRFQIWCERCEVDDKDIVPITPGSATSPATTGSFPGSNSVKRNQKGGQEGTMRFVFDVQQARDEQDTVAEYYKEEYEEYEVEVEEKAPESTNHHNHNHGHHGQGPRRDRGHGSHNHHDSGWAPYHRNRHHNDHRPKGRKGGYY